MKSYSVTLLLLLFEVNLIFGHTLSKFKLKNETEIYEVKEDQSALLITHPKDEATKLREIIYYHIIERPYDAKDLSHDKIEPNFEKRYFTNSHSGIQFEKKDCAHDDDEDESTSEELDDDSSNSTELSDDDSNLSESNEEKDNEQSSDINDDNIYGDDDSINTDKRDMDSPINEDSKEIDIRFSDFVNTTKGDAKVETVTSNVTANPETKTKGISETPQRRRKREINHTVTGIAKTVKTGEELNHADGKIPKREEGTYGMTLTGNRGVVWNDVKPTHIEYHVGEAEALTSKPDAEDITTSESTKEPTEPVIQEIDEDNQSDDDGDDDEDFIETFGEIEKILDKLIDSMDKTNTSESQQENKTDDANEKSRGDNKHEDDNEHDYEDSSLDPIEIEKSFIEIFKVFKELTADNISNPAVTDVNDATKSEEDADIFEENVSAESSNGNFLKTSNEDEEIANDTPVMLGAKLAPKRNDKDKETSNKGDDSKQQQLVKELLKNKYFWGWIHDASAAFLQILMKKLEAVIKTEVGTQIEQYFEEHNNENCKQNQIDQNNTVLQPVQTSNVTDENIKGNTSNIPNSTDQNGLASNTTEESINESNETSSEISTKKHKDKPSNDKNAESSVKIEAQNLFGSSVGSGKVTNIFIYNINKAFDLENITPIKNDANGVFIFGLDDKKPEQEKEDTSDKDTIPKFETVKPDISSEHNKTVDKVVVTDENQNSTAKPETEKDDQSLEKDKIEDEDPVKVEDNVKHLTDKSEVIPHNQTSTEANNDDKPLTEINKEESPPFTENPLEAIEDDKEKDTTTENEETKKDLNDNESGKD